MLLLNKSGLFDIWLHHQALCTPVGHGLYTRPFPFLRTWVWLARLRAVMGEDLVHSAPLLLLICECKALYLKKGAWIQSFAHALNHVRIPPLQHTIYILLYIIDAKD